MRNALFNIIMISVTFFAISCGGGSDRPDPILSQDQVAKQKNLNNTTTVSPPPAAGNSGVDHYTCPNGHPGGAAAGNCSTCGTALVHNQAFHNTTQPATTTTVSPPTTTVPTPAPEPAQNASGVWHYTCPNGHAGGAGAASACSSCGATLVHNADYHQ